MMKIFKHFFYRNNYNLQKYSNQKFKVDISLYESTYSSPLLTLLFGGLRLTRHDSKTSAKLWAFLYWFGVFNLFYSAILELIYMIEVGKGGTFDDAVEIIKMMPCIGYLVMAQIKTYKIFIHRPVFENLINELRTMWPKEAITEEEYILIIKPIKRQNFINKALVISNHLLLAFFIIPHMIDVVKTWMGHVVELKLPFFYWLPFDPHQSIVYEFLLLLQTWQALLTIWLILSCDLLFYVYMNHITTQFELLAIFIKKMVYVPIDNQLIPNYPLAVDGKVLLTRNRQTFDNSDCQNMDELKNVIFKHQTLIRLSNDVESIFSFQLLVNFIYSSVIICLCGFCCIIVEKWNDFTYKAFLANALAQTWLFCWYGQRLIDSSAGIGNSLYNSGWYLQSNKMKTSLLVILHRSQKHVRITTYGFSVISLNSYTTIIKTAWSYFTLLLNAYKK